MEKNLINSYFLLLKNFSKEAKEELIGKLKNSLIPEKQEKFSGLEKSFGGWEDSRSAEEIIAEIRESRRFREKDLDF